MRASVELFLIFLLGRGHKVAAGSAPGRLAQSDREGFRDWLARGWRRLGDGIRGDLDRLERPKMRRNGKSDSDPSLIPRRRDWSDDSKAQIGSRSLGLLGHGWEKSKEKRKGYLLCRPTEGKRLAKK